LTTITRYLIMVNKELEMKVRPMTGARFYSVEFDVERTSHKDRDGKVQTRTDMYMTILNPKRSRKMVYCHTRNGHVDVVGSWYYEYAFYTDDGKESLDTWQIQKELEAAYTNRAKQLELF